VLLVGLTGGIGSGKSTVAAMLERRGAVVIDADDFARRAVEPGTPGHARVVETFGSGILTRGGEIDRERLADVVFADAEARKRLEAIVHPDVARLFAETVDVYRDTDRIVVYVVPLLVERSLQSGFDVIVVISASPDVRLARLVAGRRMNEKDARDRMAAQLSNEERERAADVVIRNEGTLDDLERAVDGLWDDLRSRSRARQSG
jgi:dephospho-CoA kinase